VQGGRRTRRGRRREGGFVSTLAARSSAFDVRIRYVR
jgi:hypothetical protein